MGLSPSLCEASLTIYVATSLFRWKAIESEPFMGSNSVAASDSWDASVALVNTALLDSPRSSPLATLPAIAACLDTTISQMP